MKIKRTTKKMNSMRTTRTDVPSERHELGHLVPGTLGRKGSVLCVMRKDFKLAAFS
jgi:hypothetical protein